MIIKLQKKLKFIKIFNIFFIIYCLIFSVSTDLWLTSIGGGSTKDFIMLFVLVLVVLFRVLLVTPKFSNKYITYILKIVHFLYYCGTLYLLWSCVDYFLHYAKTIIGYSYFGVELCGFLILCLLKILFINLYNMFIRKYKIVRIEEVGE